MSVANTQDTKVTASQVARNDVTSSASTAKIEESTPSKPPTAIVFNNDDYKIDRKCFICGEIGHFAYQCPHDDDPTDCDDPKEFESEDPRGFWRSKFQNQGDYKRDYRENRNYKGRSMRTFSSPRNLSPRHRNNGKDSYYNDYNDYYDYDNYYNSHYDGRSRQSRYSHRNRQNASSSSAYPKHAAPRYSMDNEEYAEYEECHDQQHEEETPDSAKFSSESPRPMHQCIDNDCKYQEQDSYYGHDHVDYNERDHDNGYDRKTKSQKRRERKKRVDWTKRPVIMSGYKHKEWDICHRCGGRGHWWRNCPSQVSTFWDSAIAKKHGDRCNRCGS